jgi:hypothetical protein
MKFKYEYRSAFYEEEDIVFNTKEEFRFHFRNATSPAFEMFIEDDEIDILQIVCGPESYKLIRTYVAEDCTE